MMITYFTHTNYKAVEFIYSHFILLDNDKICVFNYSIWALVPDNMANILYSSYLCNSQHYKYIQFLIPFSLMRSVHKHNNNYTHLYLKMDIMVAKYPNQYLIRQISGSFMVPSL